MPDVGILQSERGALLVSTVSIPGKVAIPQAWPLAQYHAHKEELDAAIARVLHGGKYILGPEVQAFEKEFAAYLGAEHAIGVGSGTDALVLALRSCEIGPGDEVITTPHTAVATVAAIELAGATAVLVDTERSTCLMNARLVEGKISPRTRAIIAVHLFGNPLDLGELLDVAERRKIRLIEDCAQAHGAMYRGKRVGTWGDIACFSFYPTKNLGALGDGGMVVTGDAELARRVRRIREYGWERRYISEVSGTNSRLDELQAAILRVKLPYLDSDNRRRSEIAEQYTRAFGGRLELLAAKPDRNSVHHLFPVRTKRRSELITYLSEQGIGTAIHFPVPIHLQPAYRGRLGNNGDFPEAERAAEEILSLPLYPELEPRQVETVIERVLAWCGRQAGDQSS